MYVVVICFVKLPITLSADRAWRCRGGYVDRPATWRGERRKQEWNYSSGEYNMIKTENNLPFAKFFFFRSLHSFRSARRPSWLLWRSFLLKTMHLRRTKFRAPCPSRKKLTKNWRCIVTCCLYWPLKTLQCGGGTGETRILTCLN